MGQVTRPALLSNALFEDDVAADAKRFFIDTPGGSGAATPPLTVAGLAGSMAPADGLSATAVDGSDGAARKIAQFQDLHRNAGTLLFEGGEGVRQKAPL